MALKYKMVVADFDSTTTNSKGKVTDRTRKAVKEYREKGGIFLLNTGRSLQSTYYRLPDIYGEQPKLPFGVMQGGLVYGGDGRILSHITLDRDELVRMVLEVEQTGQYFQLYSNDELFAEKDHEFARGYAKVTQTKQKFVGKVSEFLKTYDKGVDKILVITDEDDVRGLYEKYAADKSYVHTKFVRSTAYFFEGIPVSSGKDVALRLFSKMYNIDMKDIAAIGDNYNDYPMVVEAGCGVAMGQAVEDLKAVADIVTDTCDNDGLAKFLESIM